MSTLAALVPTNSDVVVVQSSFVPLPTAQLAARHVDLPNGPLQPRIWPVLGTTPPIPSLPPSCWMLTKFVEASPALVH